MWPRIALGLALVWCAILLLGHRYGVDVTPNIPRPPERLAWVIAALAFIVGTALVWSPLDVASSTNARRPDITLMMFARANWGRIGLGFVLVAASMRWFARWEFTTQPVLRSIIVPVVLLMGAALVLAPWWTRLIRQVGVERMQRVREFERAEIAAHLHDSVLQTLTLIRKNADDPDLVAKLARAQERDLRTYLYQGRRSEAESVATALAAAINEVEDTTGIEIETVSVGDAPHDKNLRAAIAAAKEAASNAARHGVAPVSVYAEITPRCYEIFIRDSGPGFNPKRVPAGRLGIQQSIVGRVKRHGGTATVTSKVGTRTEVHVSMPRKRDKESKGQEPS